MCNKYQEHDTGSRIIITFGMSQIWFVLKVVFLCLKCISKLYLKHILENLILLQMPCFHSGTKWTVLSNERGKLYSISMNSVVHNCKTRYFIWTTSKIYSLNILICTEYSWEQFTPLSSVVNNIIISQHLLFTLHQTNILGQIFYMDLFNPNNQFIS